MGDAITAQKIYSFAAQPEQNSEAYIKARKLVTDALTARSFAVADQSPILVNIALASRPASIALSAGEGSDLSKIAEPKERKPLQFCEDIEHRLTLNMVNTADGSNLYSGTAAEYHCKGTIEQSLPYLIDAALSDLGNGNQGNNIKTHTRGGIE
ncbi:MAG: hypothetical protein V7676_06920 [Parasphingorhabdus sp.]|uniref:hypothetical protein n=1 Tax=Parasphingorhabdus sp. TaxID=2709688 RepID=UPI0030039369